MRPSIVRVLQSKVVLGYITNGRGNHNRVVNSHVSGHGSYEPRLVAAAAERRIRVNTANNPGSDPVLDRGVPLLTHPFASRLQLIVVNHNMYALMCCPRGENCHTNGSAGAAGVIGNEKLIICWINFSKFGINVNMDHDIHRRSLASIHEAKFEDKVAAIYVPPKMAANLYVDCDPWPLVGDVGFAADLVGFVRSSGGLFAASAAILFACSATSTALNAASAVWLAIFNATSASRVASMAILVAVLVR